MKNKRKKICNLQKNLPPSFFFIGIIVKVKQLFWQFHDTFFALTPPRPCDIIEHINLIINSSQMRKGKEISPISFSSLKVKLKIDSKFSKLSFTQ